MHPNLFVFGPIVISSFGFFLAAAFLLATFISWRLAKTYDLNEEKILDIAILTFFAGLIGARLYFILSHWQIFRSWEKIFLINLYPGLSLWGGFLGGALALWYFSKRAKLQFWQVADFAAVSIALGLSLANIGCFLGGCNFGVVSSSPLAVSVVGLAGKRFPLPLFEGLLTLMLFFYLFKQVVRFHFAGKILAVFLIILGWVKFLESFFQEYTKYENLWSLLLIFLGFWVFYKQSKRSIILDLRFIGQLFVSAKKRQLLLYQLKKSWYNYQVSWKISLAKLPKILKRRLNVKSTPKNIIED